VVVVVTLKARRWLERKVYPDAPLPGKEVETEAEAAAAAAKFQAEAGESFEIVKQVIPGEEEGKVEGPALGKTEA
jgi:hypothetical protein